MTTLPAMRKLKFGVVGAARVVGVVSVDGVVSVVGVVGVVSVVGVVGVAVSYTHLTLPTSDLV